MYVLIACHTRADHVCFVCLCFCLAVAQVGRMKTERDILVLCSNSPWMVPLHYSFQDDKALCLVMVRHISLFPFAGVCAFAAHCVC